METPIYRAAYRWTSEEAEIAVWRHIGSMWKPRLVQSAAIVCGVLGAIAMLVLWQRGEWDPRMYAFCVMPLIICLAILQNFQDAKNKAVALFKKNPGADLMAEWEISSQEAKYWQRGIYYTASAWKNFSKVVEAEDGFLFYQHPGLVLWLPFRAFEMPEAPERVREILVASGVPYQKIAA